MTRPAPTDKRPAAHATAHNSDSTGPSHVLGSRATPRDVWELWTDSNLMHLDADKRAKWADLDEIQRAYAKFIAYWYAADLFNLVTVVEAMLRNLNLDDRGIRTQVLTINPRFANRVPPFEAAKVRLP